MTTSNQVNEPVATYGALPVNIQSDIHGSMLAMRRAAQRARQTAQQTGTDLIVMRAGQVVRLPQAKGSQQ